MSDELEFLEYIDNLVKMEQDTLARITKMRNKGDILDSSLKEQVQEYRKFENSIKKMIETRKKKTAEISLLEEVVAHMGAKSIVSKEKDTDSIILILIQRYKIGIEEIEKKFLQLKIRRKTIINLVKRIQTFQQENIKKLENIREMIDK